MPPKAASRTSEVNAPRLLGLIVTVASLFLFSAEPSCAGGVTVLRDIPYVFMAPNTVHDNRQTFDLYLPAKGKRMPPLVVFVHGGGYWSMSDDAIGVGPELAKALVAKGTAVALVRYRLSPPGRFPDNAEDVAQAVAYLQRTAGKYGYDTKKLFLAGHSAGAHLVSLVALDEQYLRAAGAQGIAGVIAVSGIYDLTDSGPLAQRKSEILDPVFGNSEATLHAASPVTHVRKGPPFLILSAENDYIGFQPDARRFAAALRAAGNEAVQEMIVPGADHATIMRFDLKHNPARELALEFIGVAKASTVVSVLAQARRVWQDPPYSTEPFWEHRKLIQSYPVDERFLSDLKKIYEYTAFELKSYPLWTFHAIDLGKFLDAQPPGKVGKGDYLVLTNVRGEKVFWKRQQIEPYQPVIVVGLDDERNLFRLTVFYQNKLEYSWKSNAPYLMARSVGAFVHFLKPPSAELQPPTASMYALTTESFRLYENNPLAKMSDLPKQVYDVMYYRNACFSCHSFRGTDVRAGHVRARNGEPSGGFALPLESYPPEVFRRFMFEQEKSAALMGVRPNAVTGPAVRQLYDLVVTERDRLRGRQTWQ